MLSTGFSFLSPRTILTASPALRGHPWKNLRAFFLAAIFLSLLSATAEATTFRLNWGDNSNNESGFLIERLSGSNYVQIATVGANVVTYTDANLTVGSSYCYRVRAYNSAGTSGSTNAACATVKSTTSSPPPSSPPPGTSTPSGSTSTPPTATPTGNLWTDYLVSAKIRSTDNDAIGIMFRYQDEDNYYRFSWFAEGKTRRLEKRVNGTFTVLAQDTAVYTTGQTYAVQISASGSSLKVAIDGKGLFSVTDTSLSKGTVALYSYYNQGSYFDDIRVQDGVTGNTLLSDDFNDGDSRGWTMIDEGDDLGPSAWKVTGGVLAQTSNIGSRADNGKLGTYALYTRGSWANYRVALKLKSGDDDRLGVMFRVQDSDNFYRLSLDKGSPGRKLWKREKGVYTLLAQDSVPYAINQTYSVEIIAQGSSLKINIDGKPVFSVSDQSFPIGTVALYSSHNQNSFFDDVLVQDLDSKLTLLWNDFNDGKLTGWKPFDDANTTLGPSQWSVVNGTLVQSSNIGSDATGHPGTFLLY